MSGLYLSWILPEISEGSLPSEDGLALLKGLDN
jgi:hypothetical protein